MSVPAKEPYFVPGKHVPFSEIAVYEPAGANVELRARPDLLAALLRGGAHIRAAISAGGDRANKQVQIVDPDQGIVRVEAVKAEQTDKAEQTEQPHEMEHAVKAAKSDETARAAQADKKAAAGFRCTLVTDRLLHAFPVVTNWDASLNGGRGGGSALSAERIGFEPDLIAAVGTNGVEGFVKSSDLNPGVASLDESIAYMNTVGNSLPIPLYYDVDGTTVMGEFVLEANYSYERE